MRQRFRRVSEARLRVAARVGAWLFACIVSAVPAAAGCTAVDHDPITVADLAAILPVFAQAPAGAPIVPAPPPGARRTLRAIELQSLGRKYALEAFRAEDICFEWPMEVLDRNRLLEAMRAALPYAQTNIEILETSLQPAPRGRIEFRREDLGTPASAARTAVLWKGSVIYGAGRRFSIWARVLVSARLPRVVAAEPLARGQVIAPAQLRLEDRDVFPGAGDAALSLDQVSGRLALRPIPAGREIHLGQLQLSAEINRGDLVEVEVRSGAARVALAARSEAQGRSGQMVSLRNLSSNKIFQARVAGKGKAVVDAGAPNGN